MSVVHTYKNYEKKQIETASGAPLVINIVNVTGNFLDEPGGWHEFVDIRMDLFDTFPVMCGIDELGGFFQTPLSDEWGNDYDVQYTRDHPREVINFIPYWDVGGSTITNGTAGKCIIFVALYRDEHDHYLMLNGASANYLSYDQIDNTNIISIPGPQDYGLARNPWAGVEPVTRGYAGYFIDSSEGGGIYNRITQTGKILVGSQQPDTDPYSDLPVDGTDEIPGGSSIPIPGMPPASATATGIIGLFVPTESMMQALANFMWTDFGGTGTTIEDKLEEVVQALKRQIADPLNYILGLNIIPSQGLSIGQSQTVKFGFVSSGVMMPRLLTQYFTVDCGTLSFSPLCGDTFLDYAPYSKFQIYLPFIGFRELDANDCVGHTIGVYYHGDAVTGGLTAYITKDGSVLYQFSGACAINVPVSSDNWGNTISAAINAAGTIVGSAYAGAGAAGIAKAASQIASNPSLLSPSVHHSGSMAGSAGAMGVLTPFIIREAVRFHSTAYFNTISGYPSHIHTQLSKLYGYTVVLDINLEGVDATKPEQDEIKSLLQGGVIL